MGVGSGVAVGSGVGAGVGIAVAVGSGVRVGVRIDVAVGAAVGIGAAVGVGSGAHAINAASISVMQVTTNAGFRPDLISHLSFLYTNGWFRLSMLSGNRQANF